MTYSHIVYKNKVLDLDNFINFILFPQNAHISQKTSSSIKEYEEYYMVTLNSYDYTNYTFQLYYKNKFLILTLRSKSNIKKVIFKSMYFLPDINIKSISHKYSHSNTYIKICKI